MTAILPSPTTPRVRARGKARFDRKLDRVYRELRGSEAQPQINLSQLELARRLECDPGTIAKIEHRFIQMVRAHFAALGCERLSDVRFTE